MIEAATVDRLRVLAAGLAFPYEERLSDVHLLATTMELPEPLRQRTREEIEPEYHRLFSGDIRCVPYETEYGPGRAVRKAVELADIAGFYRACNLQIRPEEAQMVDHISIEMEFAAYLGFKIRYAVVQGWLERSEICEDMYRKFWRDHLGRWSLSFFENLRKRSLESGFYGALARLGIDLCSQEIERLRITSEDGLQADSQDLPAYECLGCGGPEGQLQ